MDFKEKLKSLQFPTVRTKVVKSKETNEVLGEQHYHRDGSISATVIPPKRKLGVSHLPVGD